jgi:hypothetical protein
LIATVAVNKKYKFRFIFKVMRQKIKAIILFKRSITLILKNLFKPLKGAINVLNSRIIEISVIKNNIIL